MHQLLTTARNSNVHTCSSTTAAVSTMKVPPIPPELCSWRNLRSGTPRLHNLSQRCHRTSRQRFLAGSTGSDLDAICRGQVWRDGLNYRCGTGHGVGYFLNVHEAPPTSVTAPLHWKKACSSPSSQAFTPKAAWCSYRKLGCCPQGYRDRVRSVLSF